MKQLLVRNAGEMIPEALTLMGGTDKRNSSSKIGMFGSGNKFALATLLRNGIVFRVFSGTKEIIIKTEEIDFRGQQLEIITVNGEKTSLTVSMGKDWEVWQALREFYSNAMDEGQSINELVDEIEPMEGTTSIYIEFLHPDVVHFHSNLEKYFLQSPDVLDDRRVCQILRAFDGTINLYRRDIRCNTVGDSTKALFNYNFANVSINESRLLDYSWEAPEIAWRQILSSESVEVVEKVMSMFYKAKSVDVSQIWEWAITNYGMVSISKTRKVSETWASAVLSNTFCKAFIYDMLTDEEKDIVHILPSKIFDVFAEQFGADAILPKSIRTFSGDKGNEYKPVTLKGIQLGVYEKAIEFIMDSQLGIANDIVPAQFVNNGILGFADHKKNTIVVGLGSIDKGVQDVVNTIIEEWIHLKHNIGDEIKHNVGDETRAFQTSSIDELINYIKAQKQLVI